MSRDPESVLAALPGWQDATLTELHGGLTNRTWKVVSGDRAGVLKIDAEQRSQPFNTRLAERLVQAKAAEEGLAPGVIYADDCVYFTNFVEGTVWHRDRFNDPDSLLRLASTLRRLHSLPLTGRTFDARIAADRYVRTVGGLDAEVVNRCRNAIASMHSPRNLCCCHNDLVAENILATPKLKLLDWEYACDNDPFFDLATVIEHHNLSDAQASYLLDGYLDGDGQRWWSHLATMRQLYLALWCLWLAARPDTDAEELKRVSERVLTSCS